MHILLSCTRKEAWTTFYAQVEIESKLVSWAYFGNAHINICDINQRTEQFKKRNKGVHAKCGCYILALDIKFQVYYETEIILTKEQNNSWKIEELDMPVNSHLGGASATSIPTEMLDTLRHPSSFLLICPSETYVNQPSVLVMGETSVQPLVLCNSSCTSASMASPCGRNLKSRTSWSGGEERCQGSLQQVLVCWWSKKV